MKLRHLLPALLLAAAGQADATQDLLDTYQQALREDPELAAAQAQLRAEEERLDQARSLFLPQIALEADAARNHQRSEYGSGGLPLAEDWDGRYDSHSYGLVLTQPLFRMESFTLYRQAETVIDQAELSYAIARQELVLRVAEGYFEVLRARSALESFEAELTAIAQQLRRAQRAFELGSGTITDVNDAQARRDLTRARRLQALNDVRIARERLKRITGAQVTELAPVRPEFPAQPPQPREPQLWANRAEEANLQVQLALADLAFATDEIARQRAQRYPKVDLYARYGANHQSDTSFRTSLDGEQSAVGVNLSMPLYTGGAVSSQIREAQARRERASERLRAARRAAALDAEAAYLSLQASLEQIQALEQALRSMQLNEESTRKGLELGLRSTLDLLNIQRERYAGERDLAVARYSYLLNYLRLRAAVGDANGIDAVRAVNQFLH